MDDKDFKETLRSILELKSKTQALLEVAKQWFEQQEKSRGK